jgi:hypothetical protein
MRTRSEDVGAEGVRGKHYDAYYPLNGPGCDVFFTNGIFGSTVRQIKGGTWIELDLIVFSRWQIAHVDGANTQGYSIFGGAFIYGVYTKPGSSSQAMVGVNHPNGCVSATDQISTGVLSGVDEFR